MEGFPDELSAVHDVIELGPLFYYIPDEVQGTSQGFISTKPFTHQPLLELIIELSGRMMP